jgi:hypothetical protein
MPQLTVENINHKARRGGLRFVLGQSLSLDSPESTQAHGAAGIPSIANVLQLPVGRNASFAETPQQAAGNTQNGARTDEEEVCVGAHSHGRETGRISSAARKILDEGYQKLEEIIKQLSKETGIPSLRIINLWAVKADRPLSTANLWNYYSAYLKQHKDAELTATFGDMTCGNNLYYCHP